MEESEEVLTNLMFKTNRAKLELEQGARPTTNQGRDNKLNYKKVLDNPKEKEFTYVMAIANLEELNLKFKQRIKDKNPNYNFFLDDSEDPHSNKPITIDLYKKYTEGLNKQPIYAYTVRNTWTKGKDFFYVIKGCLMELIQIYEDRIFADVKYKGQIGLMKLEELRVVVPQEDSEANE